MFYFRHCDVMTKKAFIIYDNLKRIYDIIELTCFPNDSDVLTSISKRTKNVFRMCDELCNDYLDGRLPAAQFKNSVAEKIKLIRFHMISDCIRHTMKDQWAESRIERVINDVKDRFIWVKELTEDNNLDEKNGFCEMAINKALNELSSETRKSIDDIIGQGKGYMFVSGIRYHAPETYS